MSLCQSKIFFPDDPKTKPQLSDCPREATTTRRTTRLGSKGKPGASYNGEVVRGVCGALGQERVSFVVPRPAQTSGAGRKGNNDS